MKVERRPSIEVRLEVLRELFPEVFTDGRVNVERFRELLGEDASDMSDTAPRLPARHQARARTRLGQYALALRAPARAAAALALPRSEDRQRPTRRAP